MVFSCLVLCSFGVFLLVSGCLQAIFDTTQSVKLHRPNRGVVKYLEFLDLDEMDFQDTNPWCFGPKRLTSNN